MVETGSRSAELTAYQKKVSGIVSQREQLYGRIGEGEVKPDSIDNALKIGRVKSRVQSSINNLQLKLQQIETEIQFANSAPVLIANAQEFISERDLRQKQIEEIRRYVKEGHLGQDVAAGFERDYRSFLARPRTNEDLKRGLALIEQQVKEPENTESYPKIRIDSKNREVSLLGEDGRTSYTYEDSFAVFEYLARHNFQDIPREQLRRVLKRAKSGMTLQQALIDIRSMFPADIRTKVVERGGNSSSPTYKLNANVEFLKDRAGRSERNRTEINYEEIHVHETRIKALMLMLNPEVSMQEVIETLGLSRSGRELNWAQAKFALKRAAAQIYARVRDNKANEAEVNAWADIKREALILGINSDQELKDKIHSSLETWFRDRRQGSILHL